MKRIFALLLALTLCLGMTACGKGGESTGDASTGGTAANSDKTSGTENKDPGATEVKGFNPDMEHKIILGDVENLKLLIYDLNPVEGEWAELANETPVWEWDPQTSEGCELGKISIRGFSDAKVRMLNGKKVVIACNSAGWFGLIDYETKATIWENVVRNGPHSIELTPKGDLVMIGSGGSADSGNGSMFYYPLSVSDSTVASSVVELYSGHGVQWDPDYECLWAVYGSGITAVKIEGEGTKTAKLKIQDGIGAEFGNEDKSGHDLAPVAGEPTKYWVTAEKYVWQFDTDELELTKAFSNSNQVSDKNVKGVAHFSDGTFVTAVAGQGGNRGKATTYEYSTYCLNVIAQRMSTGKVQALRTDKVQITFMDQEFYKVHSADPSYKPE